MFPNVAVIEIGQPDCAWRRLRAGVTIQWPKPHMDWRQLFDYGPAGKPTLRLVRSGMAAVWLGWTFAGSFAAHGIAGVLIADSKATDGGYNLTNELGSWIWAENTTNLQTC